MPVLSVVMAFSAMGGMAHSGGSMKPIAAEVPTALRAFSLSSRTAQQRLIPLKEAPDTKTHTLEASGLQAALILKNLHIFPELQRDFMSIHGAGPLLKVLAWESREKRPDLA